MSVSYFAKKILQTNGDDDSDADIERIGDGKDDDSDVERMNDNSTEPRLVLQMSSLCIYTIKTNLLSIHHYKY